MSASRKPAVRAAAAKENTTASSNRTLQLSQCRRASRRLTECALARSFLFPRSPYSRAPAREYVLIPSLYSSFSSNREMREASLAEELRHGKCPRPRAVAGRSAGF
jgi:hypothetical protein